MSRSRASSSRRSKNSTTTTSGATSGRSRNAAGSGSSTGPTTKRCSWSASTPSCSRPSGSRAEARASGLWKRRYRDINDWEHYLVDNGIRVVKVFLNLSREEQAKRFLKRIDRPEKNWKFSPSDVRERRFWDDYQVAYDHMLSHTSTPWAPWYVVPADHKWFARLATAAVLVRELADIDPQYPKPAPEAVQEMAAARAELLAEMA